MSGETDPLYVAARCALLDAFEAVEEHADALVLVGAQAIYLHTGEGDLAIAPFTTDGDIAIDPSKLGPTPLLGDALAASGFVREPTTVGIWTRSIEVTGTSHLVAVDFLVPDSLAGEGRRGARIPPHSKTSARRVVGLEGALVDRGQHRLAALDDADPRTILLSVAGPGALLVAKLHKIEERVDAPDRLSDKDALDVLRILRATPARDIARRLESLLADPLSEPVATHALQALPELFGDTRAPGSEMAARAASPLENPDTIRASVVALCQELLGRVPRK
jgi:hypothetical protein